MLPREVDSNKLKRAACPLWSAWAAFAKQSTEKEAMDRSRELPYSTFPANKPDASTALSTASLPPRWNTSSALLNLPPIMAFLFR
jgi:hypothetical protein